MAKLSFKSKSLSSHFENPGTFFDRSYDLVAIVNNDKKILYVNKAFSTATGLSSKELKLEKTFDECFELQFKEGEHIVDLCKSKGKYVGLREISGTFLDGRQISFEINCIPLFENEDSEIPQSYLIRILDKGLELELHTKHRGMVMQLKQGMRESINSFNSIVSLISESSSHHSQRVALMARQIAEKLNLMPEQRELIELAAQIHDVGKVGMPKDLINKEIRHMSSEEKKEYYRYPELGAILFGNIPAFDEICQYIRHQCEHYDGGGYPKGLNGDKIPLGANIICLASEFHRFSEQEDDNLATIITRIQQFQGGWYHPLVLEAFFDVVKEKSNQEHQYIRCEIPLSEIKEHMILGADLLTNKGMLLMLTEEKFTENLIAKIHLYRDQGLLPEKITVIKPMTAEELKQYQLELKAKTESKEAHHKTQILIVDDSKLMRKSLMRILESLGEYVVDTAENGVICMEMLEKKEYDLVFMDCIMPILNGIQTVKAIRSAELMVPVIMQTSLEEKSVVLEAFKSGADDYIVKPCEPESVATSIKNVMKFHKNDQIDIEQLKGFRKERMNMVLEKVAPEFLLAMQDKKTTTSRDFLYAQTDILQITDGSNIQLEECKLSGALTALSSNGAKVTLDSPVQKGEIIQFIIKKVNNEDKHICGLAKVLDSNDHLGEKNSYSLMFLTIHRTAG